MEVELKRIMPGEVRAAYLALGWTPKRGEFGTSHRKCGCGIGVLKARDGDVFAAEVCPNGDYRHGYMFGFDGSEIDSHEAKIEAMRLGFEDGQRDWLDVQDLIQTP